MATAATTGMRLARLGALACSLAILVACGGNPQTFGQLLKAIDGLDPGAKATAIEQYVAAHGGTPLVENQSRLVFLALDAGAEPPRVVGDFNHWATTPEGTYDPAVGAMTRVEGTDWWYLQGEAFTNARIEYVLLSGRDTRPDPLNPRTVASAVGPRSEARMPFFEAQPEIDDETPVPAGRVEPEDVRSAALGGTRRVWFYLPPGYDEAAADVFFPVAYVLDGGNYVQQMGVPRVLDRLIARGAIPPVIAVFVEPADRQAEYSRNAAWRRFMAAELVPLVDQRYRTFPAPARRVLVGSSLGAYGAVDLAVEAPSTFGAVVAIAPPPQTATIITNQPHAQAAALSIRFYVQGGLYDEMVDGARLLHTTLDGVDAVVTYRETPEGHNWDAFRGHLDDALAAALDADAATVSSSTP
ncbi:MAG: alpha/beta hydrolase [Vicinamibacterales bacterium]